jgi:hypothetical protein
MRSPEWWAALAWLTRLHTINRVIVCSLIYNSNLVCGKDTRLDSYDVIVVTGDHGMTIITPDRLYFMWSCWFDPTDAPRRTGDVRAEKLWVPWLGHAFH